MSDAAAAAGSSTSRLRSDPLARLAQHFQLDSRVVVITGAGLSAASGVPVFRGEDPNAIWVQRATSLGTKSAFLKAPLDWYQTFWFPLFKHSFTRCTPNAGHEAIARLATLHPGLTVVTQNIDALHQATSHRWDVDRQLIEVHGRLGLYHCASEEGSCHLATETYARAEQLFPPHVSRAIDEADGPVTLGAEHLPRCPECGTEVMPLALMFDEDYTSHAFYQFDKCMAAIEACDALVFVGTSFSVNITNLALAEARRRSVPVYNLNLRHKLNGAGRSYPVTNVLGPAEEKLQELLAIVERERAHAFGAAEGVEESRAAAPVAGKRPRSPQDKEGVAGAAGAGGEAAMSAPASLLAVDGVGEGSDDGAIAAAPPPSPPPPTTTPPEHRFALLPSPPLTRPLPLSAVRVDFQPQRYGRRRHPDPAVEEAMEASWASLLAAAEGSGGSLFNASKYRFAGCALERQAEKEGVEAALVLRLGLTDYKVFKVTDADPAQAARLQQDGERDHGSSTEYMSQKLGVSAVVVTSDGQVALIRRSLKGVAVCQGMLDTPGGHPEPSHVPAGETPAEAAAMDQRALNDAVRAEVFGSAAAEVVDEINIPLAALGPPLLIGVVRQSAWGGSPSAAFYIPCSMSATEVQACYAAGPKEAAESSELLLLDRARLPAFLRESVSGPTALTPAAEGALTLYVKLVLFADNEELD